MRTLARVFASCALAAAFGLAAPAPGRAQDDPRLLYERGLALATGIPRDDIAAIELYRRAAEAGLPEAQNALGGMYEKGRGVPYDDAEAIRWYRKAAAAGDAAAALNVARMYRRGRALPDDPQELLQWIRRQNFR